MQYQNSKETHLWDQEEEFNVYSTIDKLINPIK